MKVLYFIVLTVLAASCANVKQIERGRLSSKIMQLNPNPEESVFLEEVNSYREGAAGGSASVGGGCGCN
ncbi:MAG: arginine decarboxylase [Halobacteriovorax sp.]|nr:arginine decarboxylase [Halobacteriovorax sp.]|tara:strand:+ start:135575 stop:135781 length:207 start_codon:yes stop_codon:yes gene_type:complete